MDETESSTIYNYEYNISVTYFSLSVHILLTVQNNLNYDPITLTLVKVIGSKSIKALLLAAATRYTREDLIV